MQKIKMSRGTLLTFEESCNKYLEKLQITKFMEKSRVFSCFGRDEALFCDALRVCFPLFLCVLSTGIVHIRFCL